MDRDTRYWLEVGGTPVPDEMPGHVPEIHPNRQHGLTGRCSCGLKLGQSSGCNLAGLGYSAAAMKERYVRHLDEVRAA